MKLLRIKELADNQGLNTAQLARRADISYTTAYNLWNGTAKDVSVTTLEKIAAALGVSVRELFEPEAERKSDRGNTMPAEALPA